MPGECPDVEPASFAAKLEVLVREIVRDELRRERERSLHGAVTFGRPSPDFSGM